MALQSSGAISASDINIELLDTDETDVFTLGSTKSRDLCDIASGDVSFSDFYDKASSFVSTPVNIYPDGQTDVDLNPELESSDFNSSDGTDTHSESEYKIIKTSDSSVVYNVTFMDPTNVPDFTRSTSFEGHEGQDIIKVNDSLGVAPSDH